MTPRQTWAEEEARRLSTKGPCTCGGIDIGVGVMHEPMCGRPTADDFASALLSARALGFRLGQEAGIRRYAWWRDGVQYVGSTGTTLKDAIAVLPLEEEPDA